MNVALREGDNNTLYDDDGFLMDGNTIINSRDMVANQDGTYTVSINCSDDAINNISAPAEVETVMGSNRYYECRFWRRYHQKAIREGFQHRHKLSIV